MITADQIQNLLNAGGTVIGKGGESIGKVANVYVDERTGAPEWVTAKTGMFGGAGSIVPLAESRLQGTDLQVPYDKAQVKDAPRVEDGGGHLSPAQETQLYSHYGMRPAQTQGRDRAGDAGTVGHDASDPNPDQAMIRSEERLNVAKETVDAGVSRLRKFVVTEDVSTTVPVSHDEARIVREPITDENRDAAMFGGEITSEEHDVVLRREEVVVNKETVPVERVRLDTETVTEDQQVNEKLRKEQIVNETEDVPRRRNNG